MPDIRKLKFCRMLGKFAICRLAPDAAVPAWALSGAFSSLTRTAEELSIVCALENAPPEHKPESPWVGFKLEGPFPFTQTGVLASFIGPLAQSSVPIFAVATYDTDYVFVDEKLADKAVRVLRTAGHELLRQTLSS